MRNILGFLGLLVLCACVIPATGADDPKKTPDKKGDAKADADKKADPKDKTDAKEKLVPFGRPILTRVVDVQEGKIVIKEAQFGKWEDKTYPLAEDVKVRVENPPLAIDDKGRPKKYTAAELKEMKGPEKLWGYPSDLDSLKKEQNVQIFLGKKKNAARTDPPVIMTIYVLGSPMP